MTISFCDIELRRLSANDIEMVRQWRNDTKIAAHMFYQEFITPEMQKKWFEALHPEKDFYFLIYFNENPLGLIHLNKIDASLKTAESGLFIYDENYWGTHVPVQASLALLQFAFENKNLQEVSAKVRSDNKAAVRYNTFLGFEKKEDTSYVLSRENYQSKTLLLKQTILKLSSQKNK
jgi:UDP-4-amino-4,6-dideoxy-N-acetyl-beta-L-altrosamine N-acetyltransferase